MVNRVMQLMRVCVLLVFFILVVHANAVSNKSWPEIKAFEKKFNFNNVDEAGIDLTIRGAKGEGLYRLKCHNSDYEGDSDFNYSGAFECRLKSLYSQETVSTLLTENPKQSADWESRGRFLSEHLLGECANCEDWGRTRTFRLRGMRIILAISNEKIIIDPMSKQSTLKAFRLTVKVEKDPLAKSNIAEASPIKEPSWFYNPTACLRQTIDNKK